MVPLPAMLSSFASFDVSCWREGSLSVYNIVIKLKMYSTWRVSDLKAELKRRGASLRGRKVDLVERLEFYDKNLNFGKPDLSDTNEDSTMTLPLSESYRDINSDTKLPLINKTQIRHYLSYTSKKMDKVVQLYESRHLVVARVQDVANFTYLKGICRKTMKSLHYESNIILDENGNIEEAHCECPAGSGVNATCKHVAVLLLGVEQMVREKFMLLFETCTQRLQQFHAPRVQYGGTPVRAEKLPRKRQTYGVLFEPYPVSKIDKINYNRRIRNLVLNFPNSKMPIKQMFEPANPYALESDHDYFSVNSQSKVLKDLHISEISDDQIQLIEESTRGQNASAEWYIERKRRLTASKFHTICHLKSTTAPSYAKQIMQQKQFHSRATTHGLLNESVALKKYCEENDFTVAPCGLFISKEKPYLAASPDGLLGAETVIEIKCPFASRFQKINSTTVPYLTKDLTLKTNSPYYYQVQGQLYCTGRKYCNFIVYTHIDMKVIYINRDEAFIQNMLMLLDNFYEEHFKKELLNKYLYYNYDSFRK